MFIKICRSEKNEAGEFVTVSKRIIDTEEVIWIGENEGLGCTVSYKENRTGTWVDIKIENKPDSSKDKVQHTSVWLENSDGKTVAHPLN